MHAYAFLIRETKSGRRVARFFLFEILRGACNQEGSFWILIPCSRGQLRPSVFPEGRTLPLKKPMVKRQKGKISNFSFLAFSRD